MELIVCKDRKEVAIQSTEWLRRITNQSRVQRLFVPAGATPEPIYEYWRQTRPQFLEQLEFLQIDEIITGQHKGQFREFFNSQLEPWSGHFRPIENADTQADAAILGIGLNGHIAFHEPEIPRDFFSGCVKLSVETQKRLHLEADAWGLTYGLKAFQNCSWILLVVTGASKRSIWKRFLSNDDTLPAVQLKSHPQFTVIIDQEVQ